MKEFFRHVKTNDFYPVYVLSGEAYIKNAALDALISALPTGIKTLNFTVLDGKCDEAEIVNACESLPFMGERHAVVVKGDVPGTKTFEKYLDALPETTILVFVCDKAMDRRRSIYKKIKSVGYVADFKPLSPAERVKGVTQAGKKRGMRLTAAQAKELIRYSGTDMYTLSNEIDKLKSYTEGAEVTGADIASVASKTLEYNVFQLHDLLIAKKTGQALALLNDMLETEKTPFGILGYIASRFRSMLKAKALIKARYPEAEVVRLIGGHPYAARIAMRQCNRFSIDALRAAIKTLAELDYRLKSGRADGRFILDQTILSVYGLV